MITIGAVSRQTGIAAETLRKWEERYGFPVPDRSPSGRRQFHEPDVQALLQISRRLSAGERPGKAIPAVQREQRGSKRLTGVVGSQTPVSAVARALGHLTAGELIAFECFIESHLLAHGIPQFTRDLAFPLIEAVGALWQAGTLPAYAEHAFSSALERVVVRHARPAVAKYSDAPLVLFASPAGEMHTLALTLGQALFCHAGAPTVVLSGGLPHAQIAAAALAYGARVVALSASVACPPRLLKLELLALRKCLPGGVAIWLGGHGANRIAGHIAGIDILRSWDEALHRFNDLAHAPVVAHSAHREINHG